MASRRRKPLSDITNITLTPIAALQKLVAASSSSKLCNSNSTNQKSISESSSKSSTSIGSSNVSAPFNSKKTVQFQRPPPVIPKITSSGGIGSKDVAHNRTQVTEKSEKEGITITNTSVEKRKNKGKAIEVALSSTPEKTKENQNGNEGILKHSGSSNVMIKETGQEFVNPSSFLVPRAKDSGKPVNIVNSHEKTREKGKAIAVPLSPSPYEKMKENQNGNEGILKHTRTSNLIIKETGQEFRNSSSFLVQRAKDCEKSLNPGSSHENTKDKGKGVAVAPSSSPYEKMKENQNCNEGSLKHTRTSNLIIKETGQDFCNSSSFLVQRAKDSGKSLNPGNSHEKTKDKGKGIAVAPSSSPYEKMKDYQNGNEGIIKHSRSSNLIIKETGQDFCNSSSFLVQRAKDSGKPLNTVNSHEKTREKGKAIAVPLSSSPYKKTKDFHYANEGIPKHFRSSNLIIKETGQEFLNPSSFLVPRAKDSRKPLNTVDSHEKTREKWKAILQPSDLIELEEHKGSSTFAAVKSLPPRRQGEKRKFDAGASSCPPMMRLKSIVNNLDEAGDVKSLKSCTDPHLKRRKKTCSKIKKTSKLAQDSNDKLPEDFVEQQRAYFKEVDEFELAEEEVSPDELD